MTRTEIIRQANDKEIFLQDSNKVKHPAKIAGSKLAWPVIFAGDLCAEISWQLAERLATGETQTIGL